MGRSELPGFEVKRITSGNDNQGSCSECVVKIWLDDVREMPSEYDMHVRTAFEAIDLLRGGDVSDISLDHDLGDEGNGTGYDVAKWIEEQAFHQSLPRLIWRVHSQNTIGVKNMLAALRNADRFWDNAEDT